MSVTGWKYYEEGTQYCQESTPRNFEVIDRGDQKFSFFVHYGYIGDQKSMMDIEGGNIVNGGKIQVYHENNSDAQAFRLERTSEPYIWEEGKGIEYFLKEQIDKNFINNSDTILNKDYLEIIAETSTVKDIGVSNVEYGIYNLHTYMTNCSQNYNINYRFKIVNNNGNPKLQIYIKNLTYNKELIDVNAMNISKYDEVFDTDIVAKVVVKTNTKTFKLFLKTDRTTTTDQNDPDRAVGKTETIFTDNYEDAEQEALNIITANTYNHNISFSMNEKFFQIGTPISIKTKKSLIYDTYISSIKITENSFYDYQCGNIRINLLEKLMKER